MLVKIGNHKIKFLISFEGKLMDCEAKYGGTLQVCEYTCTLNGKLTDIKKCGNVRGNYIISVNVRQKV
jgi:hypothetical protein